MTTNLKHSFAIHVLEREAKNHDHTVWEGRNRYDDPEEQLAVYESMAQSCREAAEALKALG